MPFKFEIPPNKVEEVREWFRARGGCLRWTNKEIGVNRGDLLTPATEEDGKPYGCPHWAYVGESFPVAPEDIGVRTETAVQFGKTIHVALRKAPWIGYDLTETGKAKARKTAAKLGPDVKWDWEHIGYGLATLRFFREKTEPFTVD